MDDAIDRRAVKTRRILCASMIELVRERPYQAITVTDIARRADVGRSTFYQHFRDKHDLFSACIEPYIAHLASQIDWRKPGVPMDALLWHVRDASPFFESLARAGRLGAFFRVCHAHLRRHIAESLSRRSPKSSGSASVDSVADFVSREILGHMRSWWESGMQEPPDRVDAAFHSLVAPGLRSALATLQPQG